MLNKNRQLKVHTDEPQQNENKGTQHASGYALGTPDARNIGVNNFLGGTCYYL
jgi:hypothetical protein